MEHALLQKIIFADILDCKWQIFRSKACVVDQLTQAGFQDIRIIEDKASIFPTIVGTKPHN